MLNIVKPLKRLISIIVDGQISNILETFYQFLFPKDVTETIPVSTEKIVAKEVTTEKTKASKALGMEQDDVINVST